MVGGGVGAGGGGWCVCGDAVVDSAMGAAAERDSAAPPGSLLGDSCLVNMPSKAVSFGLSRLPPEVLQVL